MTKSLQERYAPNSICFGCGPANLHGLQIKSFVAENKIIAEYTPKPHHHAFPNVLCGGIIGTLLDCHCNWASCYYLMKKYNEQSPPCTVTANYLIDLKRPTPMNQTLSISARLDHIHDNTAHILGEITINEKIYATCKATFVAVKEGHPAYHRH